MIWVLGDGKSIIFWYDSQMEDSPLIDKVHPHMSPHIQDIAKVSDVISSSKTWNTRSLIHILPIEVINKINAIPSPISIIQDYIKLKFRDGGEFSIKTATWDNNKRISPHPKS